MSAAALTVECANGATLTTGLALPPGAPELAERLAALDWPAGAALLRQTL